MKGKILSALVGAVLVTATAFATPVFPNAFQPTVNSGQNCSISSDIVPTFCAPSGAGSFQAAVKSCAPSGMSMQGIYLGMIAAYGSLQTACTVNARKYGGTVQGCVGQWTCYWYGGASKDMSGLCNGNGQACASL